MLMQKKISIHLMLMLIRFKNAAHSVWNRISIHLMLMLIWKALIFHQSKTNFNTSHVNVNPLNVISSTFYLSYFNTSHVNVNRACGHRRKP